MKSTMMVHTCNSSTGRPRQEDEFKCEANLGYLVRPCLKQINTRTNERAGCECVLSVWSLLLRSLG